MKQLFLHVGRYSEDRAGSHENEGDSDESSADDEVGLDWRLPALVAEVSPHGRREGVGAILQLYVVKTYKTKLYL